MVTVNITGDSNRTSLVISSENSTVEVNYNDELSGNLITDISYVNLYLSTKEKLDNYLNGENGINRSDAIGVYQIDQISENSYDISNLYTFNNHGNTLDNYSLMLSTGKAHLSLMFGAAILDTSITSLEYDTISDKLVYEYFPELSGTILGVCTIDDLLSGSCGLPAMFNINDTSALGKYFQSVGTDMYNIIASLFNTINNGYTGNNVLTNAIQDHLVDYQARPLYNYRSNSRYNSETTKEFSGQEKPEDLVNAYTNLPFDIAGLILQKIVAEDLIADGNLDVSWNSEDGYDLFNNWRLSKLDNIIGEGSHVMITKYVDGSNVYVPISSGTCIGANKFVKNMALLIKNGGKWNGVQIIDASYVNDITDVKLDLTTGYPDPTSKYRKLSDYQGVRNQYFCRGVWCQLSRSPADPKAPIYYLSGNGGVRVMWTVDKVVSYFRRTSTGLKSTDFSSNSYNFPTFYEVKNNLTSPGGYYFYGYLFDMLGAFGSDIPTKAYAHYNHYKTTGDLSFSLPTREVAPDLDEWRDTMKYIASQLFNIPAGWVDAGLDDKDFYSLFTTYPFASPQIHGNAMENLLHLESAAGIKLVTKFVDPTYY